MKNFEKLKAKWDKKLLDSGFEDIENKDGTLKSEGHLRTLSRGFKDSREQYYREAQNFLNTYKFDNKMECGIWNMHSEGTSFRTIASVFGITFYKVRTIVVKLQKIAGVKRE